MSNIIEVTWGNSDLLFVDASEYDYNYGMQLHLNDTIEDGVAYEMHFSNAPSGISVNAIVSVDGYVNIPDSARNNSANTIFGYLFVVGSGYGYTYKEVRIAKRDRPELPTGEEPTPEEQGEIEQLLVELRGAVEQTEADVAQTQANVSHYPQIVNGFWCVYDATSDDWISTGVRAEGTNGKGISSVAKTSTSGVVDTYTITYTDGTTTTYTVTNGTDGTNGVSPTVSVTTITGGHTVSVTDANGTQSFDVMDGETDIIKTPEETEADLYVCDEDGNVIAEFADGHITTKNFDSGDIEERVEALEDSSEYAPSINPTNADADLYIADEHGNAVARFGNGHIQTMGFDSRAITPRIITVKKDGTGDFTSIRSAVESIHDASSLERPYVIEIYPGTYNILDDYSQAEIEATGFVGLMLTDGISLRGVGNRNTVVLHGELDPDTYDSTLRNKVSTLNMCDTASLENLTITAKRIRYCVHDDFPATLPYFYRHVKNCRFSIDTPTSGSEGKTWGEGAKQGKSTLLEDSDFGTCLLWHSDNTASATRTINLTIKNCTAQFLTVRNINHNIFNTVHIYGGNFGIIRFAFDDGTVQTKMMSVDGDVKDAMILAPTDWCYKTGDITIFPISTSMSLVIGMLVRPNFSPFWTQGSLVVVTDPNTAYGVVVGIDDKFAYVQKSGYINTDRIGLQNVSIGDKVTVSQNGNLELNGTGDEFGVVFASFTDLGSYVRRT